MTPETAEDLRDRYFVALAAACVRGGVEGSPAGTDEDVVRWALRREVRLHKFKRKSLLPRVRRVLGLLEGIQPASLVDVGSGRGAFLWPLLEQFSDLRVTAVESNERRASDLMAVSRGGVDRLTVLDRDFADSEIEPQSADVVTLLEVLEHLEVPEPVARAAVATSRRFVIASVPSKEDDNPEHLRVYDGPTLAGLLEAAGATRVQIEHVPNHLIAIATIEHPPSLKKYPRTLHIQGSRLGAGDHDAQAVPFRRLRGRHLVVEEKIDGANAGISFDPDDELLLQSRGHFLRGGPREKHFALFKTWANCHIESLRSALGSRYVMFGEWVYAKHTVFYDRLPHYFLEFDVLDRHRDVFLSTERRRELLLDLPVASVPVLATGAFSKLAELSALVRPSSFKSELWREHLDAAAASAGVGRQTVVDETDPHDEAEGLYIKVEEQGEVVGRYKFVRHSFLTSVLESESHWLDRPIVANRLADGVDLYAPRLP